MGSLYSESPKNSNPFLLFGLMKALENRKHFYLLIIFGESTGRLVSKKPFLALQYLKLKSLKKLKLRQYWLF
jgi:hypothetical protein